MFNLRVFKLVLLSKLEVLLLFGGVDGLVGVVPSPVPVSGVTLGVSGFVDGLFVSGGITVCSSCILTLVPEKLGFKLVLSTPKKSPLTEKFAVPAAIALNLKVAIVPPVSGLLPPVASVHT